MGERVGWNARTVGKVALRDERDALLPGENQVDDSSHGVALAMARAEPTPKSPLLLSRLS